MTHEKTDNAPVTILYFASLSEQVGLERETLTLPPGVDTMGKLRDWLSQRPGAWNRLRGDTIRCAINQEIAPADTPVSAGDEVAFFPPVTGG